MVYDEFNRKYIHPTEGSPEKELVSEKSSFESTEQDSLDWAKEVYARLKSQQQDQKLAEDKSAEKKLDISTDSENLELISNDFLTVETDNSSGSVIVNVNS